MKPVIGIPRANDWQPLPFADPIADCREAIEKAGGQVDLLYPREGPVVDQLTRVDALLIPGGPDVDPSTYGEALDGAVPHSLAYDRFELAAAERSDELGMPTLGICRGSHIMNIEAGGTLVQDLPKELATPVDHRPAAVQQDPRNKRRPAHAATLLEGSVPNRILGSTKVHVNSNHHQAVDTLGADLEAVAWAPDGVVEAFQDTTDPGRVGLQFHPEAQRHTDERMQGFFDELVADARRYRWAQE